MQRTVRTRSGRVIALPTAEQDESITTTALSDPDAQPLTDAQLRDMRPMGRPRLARPKVALNMRVDAEVLSALRSSGKGWQTRVNALLRKAVVSGKL